MVAIIGYLALTLVSVAVVWKGSGWLESASERLAAYYELPDIVQGAIVVAIGSSFPELSTTVISTLVHGEFQLGVAAIVGSAIFNILVIPAISGLFSGRDLEANRDLVYKEAQFYMISVAVLLLAFSFAVIYRPVEGEPGQILGEMGRVLALMPIALYVLYLFLQYQDTMDFIPEESAEDISPGRQWGILLLGLATILLGVEGLVRSAVRFGEIFDTPTFFWGVTVVAAGTSIPDAFVSARAAKSGKAVTSLANVLGSNIFDLLVAIPVGVLIAGAAVIDYSIAAPMMGVLTLATILLFTFMRTHMMLTGRESWVLLLSYAIFVVWMALESFGITHAVL
jgi:cation:H+ antiporter